MTTAIGSSIPRREDPRFLTGRGRFVDDLRRPHTAHLAVVRSPHPHARIASIDASTAAGAPGVLAVYVAADIERVVSGTMPVAPSTVFAMRSVPGRFPIARSEACYQGEPVAVVVAETGYAAADAAQLLAEAVAYEPLPAVTCVDGAVAPGSPRAHEDLPDNVAWDMAFSDSADEAFAEAEVVLGQRIVQQRVAPSPLEPRAVLAEWDPADRFMTVWASTQNPHYLRRAVSGAMGIPESRFRVVSPDVGGGFGGKAWPYPEDYLVPAASRLLGRPVKWAETRTENLQASTHGRGETYDVELAGSRDGTLLGLRVTQHLDAGAYVSTFSSFQASACLLAGGVYNWKQIAVRVVGVLTNRAPTDIYRGAGKPEVTMLVERMVDLFAREIGMDPAAVRRRNFIRPEQFPYTSLFGLTYDSGRYGTSLDRALEISGYEEFRREQEAARARGRLVGAGISSWIEMCGFGPAALTAFASGGLALTESAQVRVFPTGAVDVSTGSHSHGQGHETTFPQIVADALGVPMDRIELRHGDTAEGAATGYGTWGSRSLAMGGLAVLKAARKVRDKATRIAAHLLDAAEADVVLREGEFSAKGRRLAFAEVAAAAYGGDLPPGMEIGLDAVAYFDPPNFVWPFGTHVCMVEVDPATGRVEIQRYAGVDDCGNVVNPTIVEGQVHGGIAQGIGQALYEEVVYDEDGALGTKSMLDYMIPTPHEIPPLVLDRMVTPSPSNELGVKGIGEAGAIAAPAAVINAICDALAPLGVRHVDMPASPDRLWRLIDSQSGVRA